LPFSLVSGVIVSQPVFLPAGTLGIWFRRKPASSSGWLAGAASFLAVREAFLAIPTNPHLLVDLSGQLHR
jgi:hypothetical protein